MLCTVKQNLKNHSKTENCRTTPLTDLMGPGSTTDAAATKTTKIAATAAVRLRKVPMAAADLCSWRSGDDCDDRTALPAPTRGGRVGGGGAANRWRRVSG